MWCGFLQPMHGNKHSISFRVVPAPSSVVPTTSSVVPAKAGTQSCAEKNDKVIVFTNGFLGPCLRRGDGERGEGDGKRNTVAPKSARQPAVWPKVRETHSREEWAGVSRSRIRAARHKHFAKWLCRCASYFSSPPCSAAGGAQHMRGGSGPSPLLPPLLRQQTL